MEACDCLTAIIYSWASPFLGRSGRRASWAGRSQMDCVESVLGVGRLGVILSSGERNTFSCRASTTTHHYTPPHHTHVPHAHCCILLHTGTVAWEVNSSQTWFICTMEVLGVSGHHIIILRCGLRWEVGGLYAPHPTTHTPHTPPTTTHGGGHSTHISANINEV